MIFEEVHIENFRGIHDFHIEKLNNINVFFGKNNCCKTSILEALFLLSGQSNPVLPLNINRGIRKFESFSTLDDLSIQFYNLNTATPIRISSKGIYSRNLTISVIQSSSKNIDITNSTELNSTTTNEYIGLKLNFDNNKSATIYKKSGVDTSAKIEIDNNYSETLYCEFVAPAERLNEHLSKKLGSIITDKRIDGIVSVLSQIDNKITNIQVVGDKIMVDIGNSKLLPINVMGDGIIRILNVIIAIYNCANGIVLIDEIDNGLHFSSMPQLWKAVITAASENNVQVFTTTHNIDSIKSLNQYIQENGRNEILSAVKLIKTEDDDIKVIEYNSATLDYMIKQEIEIR